MRDLYYAGIELKKDLMFCDYVKELRERTDVLIIKEPHQFLVHEMRYTNNSAHEREAIGITHEGYEFHYIIFLYRGLIFMMDAATHFPFTDENEPGAFNFLAYKRYGKTQIEQYSYFVAYHGLHSIDKWLDQGCKRGDLIRNGSTRKPIDLGITEQTADIIDHVVRNRGAFREFHIWKEGDPVLLRSDTWNNEHQVIDVICSNVCDSDGRRGSFSVDLKTKTICA